MSDMSVLLQLFFDGENQISLEKVLEGKYQEPYQALLEPLVRSASAGLWPLLLPYSRKSELCFYAGAEDGRALEELRQVLSAFLGTADTLPDYGLISNSTNDAENVLLKWSKAGLLRINFIDGVSEPQKYRVFKALASVLLAYQQRPAVSYLATRPLGRVIRDFMLAYLQRKGDDAWNCYVELKLSGGFSPSNLLSLELQALAAASRWNDIVHHPKLPNLLIGRMPLRLTRILLRALGQLGLNQLLITENISASSRDELIELCYPFSSLFMDVPLFEKHPSLDNEWKLWGAGGAVFGNKEVFQKLPIFIDEIWLRNIAQWSGLELVNTHIVNEALDLKDTIAPLSTPGQGPEAVRVLLENAQQASQEEMQSIWDELQAMPGLWFAPLSEFPILNSIWKDLQNRFSKEQLGGWSGWFDRLSNDELISDVLEREAFNFCDNWPIESFKTDELLNVILSGSALGQATLRNTVPILMNWLYERDVTCSSMLWLELLELVALDSVIKPTLLSQAAQLTQCMLEQPFTANEYARMTDAIIMLWESNSGPEAYSGMLELMDVLLEAPCPQESLRRQVWQLIQDFALKRWRQIKDPLIRQLTQIIMRGMLEVGEQGPEFDNGKDPENEGIGMVASLPDLKGKMLAVYTLTEGAARRAREILEANFAGLRIEINSDHTATPALCHLAKTADYFVFAARSATHQAFYPITNSRKDIIYPYGKGASSIIREFMAALT
jgi:hypothetical protein